MKTQLLGTQSLFGITDAWLAEIQSSPDHKILFPDSSETLVDNSAVTDGRTRINFWESYTNLHPFPRITIKSSDWTYDARGTASCRLRVTQHLLVEQIRLRPNPTTEVETAAEFEAMTAEDRDFYGDKYIEVTGALEQILAEASWRSYDPVDVPEGYDPVLSQVDFSVIDGPTPWQSQELGLKDTNDENLVIWWSLVQLTASVGA